MIRIEIEPETDAEHYVLRVRDGQNGNVLLSSTSQGYNHATDAEKLARRLFGGPSGTSSIAFAGGGAGGGGGGAGGASAGVKLGPGGGGGGGSSSTFGASGGGSGAPEPVELVIRHRNGSHRTERIR